MRRLLSAIKLAAIFAGVALCAVCAYLIRRSPVFEEGEAYEYYFGASSAEILSSENPLLDKLLHKGIRGESVRYEGDRYEEVKSRLNAKLLFTEQACGITNYYLYSPALGDCVMLCGEAVNLHIAVGNGQTAAGTPLIFGGF